MKTMSDTPEEMPDNATDQPLVIFAQFAYNQEQFIREAVEGRVRRHTNRSRLFRRMNAQPIERLNLYRRWRTRMQVHIDLLYVAIPLTLALPLTQIWHLPKRVESYLLLVAMTHQNPTE